MTIIEPTRRGFLRGLGLVVAAPAIVRAASLMPVRGWTEFSAAPGALNYLTLADWAARNRPDYKAIAAMLTESNQIMADMVFNPAPRYVRSRLPDSLWRLIPASTASDPE